MNKNLKDIIKVFTITNSGNFFSLLFLVVLGKTLTTSQFGLATAMIGFVGLCGIIYAFLPSIISKYISQFAEKNVKKFYYYNLKKYLALVFFFSLLIFICQNFIFNFLKFDSLILLILIILMFIFNGVVSYNDGIILGKQNFLYHSQAVFLLNFLRLILLFIFLNYFLDVSFVLLSFIISYLSVIIFQYLKLKKNFSQNESLIDKKFNFLSKDALSIILINLVIIFLLNSELVLSRYFLDEDSAGIYNGISSIGKISFYLVNSLAPIVIPKTVFLDSKKQDSSKFILYILILTISVSLISSLFYFFFKDVFIETIFNESYLKLNFLIFIMNINYSLLAASSVLLNFLVVKTSATRISLSLLPIFLISVLFFSNVYPLYLSLVILLVNFLLFALLILMIFLDLKKSSNI